MTRILALAGKAGSGKDYVCERLSEVFVVQRVAWADEVKRECSEEFGEQFPQYDFWAKPTGDHERAILQRWGTDYRRAQDPDYWVKRGLETIAAIDPAVELVVITDTRFANEAEAVRAAGGFTAEVFAEDHIRAERLGGKLPPAHASEVMDFDTDALILNHDYPVFPPALNEFLGAANDLFQPFALTGE